MLAEKVIDKWFFIRYSDPDIHLRVRFHIIDFEKFGDVLRLVNMELEPLMNQKIISKITTDTYKRELDRYGDNSIELVEQLFCNDSIFVTNMLSLLDSESSGTIRWQMALRSVDEFLNDFKFSMDDKYEFINKLSASFFKEHGGEKNLKLTLDNKFRSLRTKVEEVLNESTDEEKEYYSVIEFLKERSSANQLIINELLELNNNKQLQLSLSDLLASLLHMNLDRLFMGRNRTNEFVVYDLLTRYYKSAIARSKKEVKLEPLV